MRKYTIGAIAGLVSALAFSSVASADVTALDSITTLSPVKQDKKVRGPISATVTSIDTHAGDLPCPLGTASSLSCYAFPPSQQTVIGFPGDFKFDPGNLQDCNLASLLGKSSAAATATCPRSVLGSGTVIQQFSDGRRINGVLTMFNGAPSGGSPTIYIHTDLPGVESKPILNGPIRGTSIVLQIPPVQGSVIERFEVALPKKVTGKKGKTKRYYLSARCSKRKWPVSETVTYQGGKVLSDSTIVRCKQKK